MDEFAQSRGDDDLFDDEIIPIQSSDQSVQEVTAQVESTSLEHTLQSTQTQPAPTSTSNTANRGRGRGRGRDGQVREQPKHNDLANSKWSSKPQTPKSKEPKPTPAEPKDVDTSTIAVRENTEIKTDDSSQTQPPTGPSNPTPARPPAVRGDRTNTGGIARPKLTEAQLAEKLQAAKERSQNLAAAHARAQADADNFAERERIATHKRAKETAERKVMEGERERNRERKLRGQGGREWDARKHEDDYAGRGRGGSAMRKGFGPGEGPEESDLRMYEWQEDRGRGRGRGGRGQRGRGGRGDGRGAVIGGQHQKQPDLIDDFPALPGSKGQSSVKAPVLQRKESEAADIPITASWADQVESSEAAKANKT